MKEETTRYFLFPRINVTNIFFSTYDEKFNLMEVQAGTWKTSVLSYVQCISIHAMHTVLTGASNAKFHILIFLVLILLICFWHMTR